MKKALSLVLILSFILLFGCDTTPPPDTTEEVTTAVITADTEAVTDAETEAPSEFNEYGEKAMKQLDGYFANPADFPFSFKYNGETVIGVQDILFCFIHDLPGY